MAVHKTAASSRISDILDYWSGRFREGAANVPAAEPVMDVTADAAAARHPSVRPGTLPEKKNND